MISDRSKIWSEQSLLIICAILAGYFGSQLAFLSRANSPPERLKCRELQIVDAHGTPLITLASERNGPKIKLIGKDGVQAVTLEVIDTITKVDNRMARIAFSHSELEDSPVGLFTSRDRSSSMFMGQPDSYGSIYMNAQPAGAYAASSLSIGYFSGPHVECFANSNQTKFEVGTGGSYIYAGKIGEKFPYLRVEDSEKRKLIDLTAAGKKTLR